MYHGILPVNKPKGLTSHDVVFKLRKILKTKKVGHTGTLDPEVTGVLPVCIGSATKVSEYIMEMGKTYRATIAVGQSTTTEDQTGDVLDSEAIEVDAFSNETIDDVLASFLGETTQIPPMYSSVKVKGKRLYEYARNNETVERPERQIYIHKIARLGDLNYQDDMLYFEIEVTCGKGTYIRTLATDIGRKLGKPAHMHQLERTNSGGFNLNDSFTLEEIRTLHEQEKLQSELFPLEYGLNALLTIEIDDDQLVKRILNGQKFKRRYFKQDIKDICVMKDIRTNKALAIYEIHPSKNDELKPKKVFN
ncbi:tRNA pseudouridine(55) synthase TruB [Staphylococcus massiliensis]|uniref:tRNA pseudouridine synthase B n=1 Tax=Staphylococcus massiliensis S46 TaxID=1229783 RepID=K9B9R6_9STAP|nr:tRNA pseudouridine(55) synthase TruB [Staphylococcus massiliensis]EKU50490.1 tRNA pseudouridine synthase B [Staphylococcus massiliensis S46]MCG3401300.1 tRNA pseudouridine(55) synthase TruB [Staphylococcus massiliensis]POA00359.1 tRNA pseudouridine(55) synthase TruB [Staphylococcus massiliensis CCUG 55927]